MFFYKTISKLRWFFFGILFEIFSLSLLLKIKLMKKNYFYSIILMVFLCSLSLSAQASKQPVNPNTPYLIEGLNLYPNPVNSSRIVNISTKNDSDKEIIIFDLLGKKVLQTQLSTRELNVANLIPGVYIIKINEGNASATRKLIIR